MKNTTTKKNTKKRKSRVMKLNTTSIYTTSIFIKLLNKQKLEGPPINDRGAFFASLTRKNISEFYYQRQSYKTKICKT